MHQHFKVFRSLYAVKILNIGRDKNQQTEQTKIRLLVKSSLIRVNTVCHSHLRLLDALLHCKPKLFHFRTLRVPIFRVPIFRRFPVKAICKAKPISMAAESKAFRLITVFVSFEIHVMDDHSDVAVLLFELMFHYSIHNVIQICCVMVLPI